MSIEVLKLLKKRNDRAASRAVEEARPGCNNHLESLIWLNKARFINEFHQALDDKSYLSFFDCVKQFFNFYCVESTRTVFD